MSSSGSGGNSNNNSNSVLAHTEVQRMVLEGPGREKIGVQSARDGDNLGVSTIFSASGVSLMYSWPPLSC
jgi:hypothetical protein